MKHEDSAVIVINIIIKLLGVVLLTEFYSFLFNGLFTYSGWAEYFNILEQYIPKDSFRYQWLVLLKYAAPLAIPLLALGLAFCAFACIVLFARFYLCLFLSFAFFIAWALYWDYPGIWSFELLFPAIFALFAGLASRHLSFRTQSLFRQLAFSPSQALISNTLLSFLLYYVTVNALNVTYYAQNIAFFSAASFFILSISMYSLNRQKFEKDKDGLADFYLDLMTVSIGAMLVLQVFDNYFSDVFELQTFKNSLIYYAQASNVTWIHYFLQLSAEYSKWILPFYIVLEIFLALSLCLLLCRGPLLLITSGLLAFLALSELGVSGQWPPTPYILTWEWELLLATCVSLFIGVQRSLLLIALPFSLKEWIFGKPLAFKPLPLYLIIAFSMALGIILYFIGFLTHVSEDKSQSTAFFSGTSFALLVFILLISNPLRGKRKNRSLGLKPVAVKLNAKK